MRPSHLCSVRRCCVALPLTSPYSRVRVFACSCVYVLLLVASTTSEARSGWTKALNKALKEIRAAQPTSGWLIKQGGRASKGFLSSFFAKNKRRWFVLTQPAEGDEATFRYYDGPPTALGPEVREPRGAVVLNRDAKLAIDSASKLANAFVITSQGASDAKAICTTLAAETNADLARWMKALHGAIGASGGKVKALKDLGKDFRGAAKAAHKPGALVRKASMERNRMMMQLERLEREELMELKVKVLHDLCDHLDVVFDRRKDKDKRWLVDHILSQRRQHDTTYGKPGLRTWGSQEQMFSAAI